MVAWRPPLENHVRGAGTGLAGRHDVTGSEKSFIIDAPVLADDEAPGQSVLEDGAHVSAETSRRLACDASRVLMRHDPDGRVVEVGARTRTIPPALRRALHHRDRGCRFPGLDVGYAIDVLHPLAG